MVCLEMGVFFIRSYERNTYQGLFSYVRMTPKAIFGQAMALHPESCLTSQPCIVIVAVFGKGNIMKALRRILAIASAAALVTIAGPAWAAGPYTITAGTTSGGDVAFTAATTGVSPQIHFNTPNVEMACASGTAAGLLHTGSNPTGVNIAGIDSTTWTDCLGPLNLPMTVTQTGAPVPWRLNVTGTPTSGVTVGTIDQVSAHVEATGDPDTCQFDVTGSVDGNFNESGQALTITTPTAGAALRTTNVVGCFGLVDEGGPATFEGVYAISNPAGPITITSP